MPIEYFIVGFLRTATTAVYNLFVKKFPDNNGYLHLYEPFNTERLRYALRLGFIWHDKEGILHHDYDKLPSELLRLLSANAQWFYDWIHSDTPYLPFLGDWMRVIEGLNSMRQPIIVKDVHVWIKLKEIVETLTHTRFLLLVRDFEYVEKDFTEWYNIHTKFISRTKRCMKILKEFSKQVGICKLLSPYLIKQGLKYLFQCDLANPRYLFSVSLFYRYFNGPSNYPKKPNFKVFILMLREVYQRYVNIVREVEHYDNVHVIHYQDRLCLDEVVKLLRS